MGRSSGGGRSRGRAQLCGCSSPRRSLRREQWRRSSSDLIRRRFAPPPPPPCRATAYTPRCRPALPPRRILPKSRAPSGSAVGEREVAAGSQRRRRGCGRSSRRRRHIGVGGALGAASTGVEELRRWVCGAAVSRGGGALGAAAVEEEAAPRRSSSLSRALL
jgi:hypothetical protein